MRESTTDRRGRHVVLPLLATLLAGTVGLVVYAVSERQDLDHAYTMAEADVRLPKSARAGRARVGEPEKRGTLVAAPTNPAEVREMVAFCDTARASDVATLRDTALRAEDPLAAGNAVRALGRLRAVAKDPQVAALVGDPRPRVRDETILALGESGDPAAVALLAPLVRGEDAKVRLLALRATGRIGGPEADALAREVLEDPDSSREELAFARTAARTTTTSASRRAK